MTETAVTPHRMQLTPEEQAQWQEKVTPVYDMIAGEVGQETLDGLFAAIDAVNS